MNKVVKILIFTCIGFFGCRTFTGPTGNEHVFADRWYPFWSNDQENKVRVLNYDGTRRAVYFVKDNFAKFCAEPSPDLGLNTGTNINLKVPTKGEVSANNQETTIALDGRTQRILFLREALYRLCEMSLNYGQKNGDKMQMGISQQEYYNIYKNILITSIIMDNEKLAQPGGERALSLLKEIYNLNINIAPQSLWSYKYYKIEAIQGGIYQIEDELKKKPSKDEFKKFLYTVFRIMEEPYKETEELPGIKNIIYKQTKNLPEKVEKFETASLQKELNEHVNQLGKNDTDKKIEDIYTILEKLEKDKPAPTPNTEDKEKIKLLEEKLQFYKDFLEKNKENQSNKGKGGCCNNNIINMPGTKEKDSGDKEGRNTILKGKEIRMTNTLFEYNKAILTMDGELQIKEIFHFLEANPNLSFAIVGQSSPENGNGRNKKLSSCRALEIRKEILKYSAKLEKLENRLTGIYICDKGCADYENGWKDKNNKVPYECCRKATVHFFPKDKEEEYSGKFCILKYKKVNEKEDCREYKS